jgi:hypothetical protein
MKALMLAVTVLVLVATGCSTMQPAMTPEQLTSDPPPPDLQAARIIEKVCGSFLSVTPQILGHLSFDPEIEKAVNQMVPFPLNRQNSPAALDLKEIALNLLGHCYSQADAVKEVQPGTEFPPEDAAVFHA